MSKGQSWVTEDQIRAHNTAYLESQRRRRANNQRLNEPANEPSERVKIGGDDEKEDEKDDSSPPVIFIGPPPEATFKVYHDGDVVYEKECTNNPDGTFSISTESIEEGVKTFRERSEEQVEEEEEDPVITEVQEQNGGIKVCHSPSPFITNPIQKKDVKIEDLGSGESIRDVLNSHLKGCGENKSAPKTKKKRNPIRKTGLLRKKIERIIYLNTVIQYWKLDPDKIAISTLLKCCDNSEYKYIMENIELNNKLQPDLPYDDLFRKFYHHLNRSVGRFLLLKIERDKYLKEYNYQCDACKTYPNLVNGIKLRRCARCKKTHYCNTTCQGAVWKEHKKVCKKV